MVQHEIFQMRLNSDSLKLNCWNKAYFFLSTFSQAGKPTIRLPPLAVTVSFMDEVVPAFACFCMLSVPVITSGDSLPAV